MKKVFSLCFICLLAISAMAQRAAVMKFNAGADVSETDVDGLECIFTRHFRPAGYTIIECAEVDSIIAAQQMQRSTLTLNQMLQIGRLLNLSEFVIGDVMGDKGYYHVAAHLVNVECGTIVATEEITFLGTSGSCGIQTLAHQLAARAENPESQTPCEVAPENRLSISLTDLVTGDRIASDDVRIFIDSVEVEYVRNDNNYTVLNYEQYRNITFTITIVYGEYKSFTIQNTNIETLATRTYSLSRIGANTEIFMDWTNRDSSSPYGSHDLDTHVKVFDHNNNFITKICFYNRQYSNDDIRIKLNRDDVSSNSVHGETITIDYLSENGRNYTFYYFLHDYPRALKRNIFNSTSAYVTFQNQSGETRQFLPQATDELVELWHIFSIHNDQCTVKDEQGVVGDGSVDTGKWHF